MSFQLNVNKLPVKSIIFINLDTHISLVTYVVPPGLKVRLDISLDFFYENFKELFVFNEVNYIQTT